MIPRARPSQGSGYSMRHVYLIVDGSGSMKGLESTTNQPKNKQVAHMVQGLIDKLALPAFTDTYLSILCYDAAIGDGGQYTPRIEARLTDYHTHAHTYLNNRDLSLWDPVRNHCGATPIGAALAYTVEKAAEWVNLGEGNENRRAVCYLMSDGMNNVGSDGKEVRDQIDTFNQESSKGVIRLSTIGYYQQPIGADAEEDEGRQLLKALPANSNAFFESNQVDDILAYIMSTISVLA